MICLTAKSGKKELADFIRASDTVIWLVSPDSVKSKWCNWELGEVGRLNKRLVPIQIRVIAPEELPENLGKIHMLPAQGIYAVDQHFAILVATLNPIVVGSKKQQGLLTERASG